MDAKFATPFNESLSNRRGPSSVAHVLGDDRLALAFLMKQQAAEEDGEIG